MTFVDDSKTEAAKKSAEAWLSLTDREEYSKNWHEAREEKAVCRFLPTDSVLIIPVRRIGLFLFLAYSYFKSSFFILADGLPLTF